MVAAYLLHRDHEITVFEAADYVGGHTNTIEVQMEGRTYAIDTGFIVFNDWTYPNFVTLLNKLGVKSQLSDMSFSVKCERTGLEYNGTSLNRLFAQRRNLFRPSFYRMIRDILRFNRKSIELLRTPELGPSLGSYLERGGYTKEFIDHYIVPMGAAIWSASHATIWEFPARYLVQFFKNHGMLSVDERPTWRVVTGGSQRYVENLVAPFRERILLNSAVESVSRFPHFVELRARLGDRDYRALRFDHVIIAAHSNQALAMLADPSPTGKRYPQCDSLSGERGCLTHRLFLAAKTEVGLGGLELSFAAKSASSVRGYVPYESATRIDSSTRILCDAQSYGGDQSEEDLKTHYLSSSHLFAGSSRRSATTRRNQRG